MIHHQLRSSPVHLEALPHLSNSVYNHSDQDLSTGLGPQTRAIRDAMTEPLSPVARRWPGSRSGGSPPAPAAQDIVVDLLPKSIGCKFFLNPDCQLAAKSVGYKRNTPEKVEPTNVLREDAGTRHRRRLPPRPGNLPRGAAREVRQGEGTNDRGGALACGARARRGRA